MIRFATLMGNKVIAYSKAEKVEDVVPAFIRRIFAEDGNEIPKGNLPLLVAAVQEYVNVYGESIFENQESDDKYAITIVSAGEAADHLCNRGWIVADDTTLNNSIVQEAVGKWFEDNNIKDYEQVKKNTYKVSFTSKQNTKTFTLIDAVTFGACMLICNEDGLTERVLNIEDVTDIFVDTDGTITNTYFKRS